MKKILHFCLFFGLIMIFAGTTDSFAATKSSTKKQSAIQMGTKVRNKVEATGVYDEECYNKYFGCMDQFCISDNDNGGTCICSNDITKYEKELDEIKNMMAEAERISTEDVEYVKAGANADIIFGGGERIYNEDGSVAKTKNKPKSSSDKPKLDLKISSLYDNDDDEEDTDLADKIGQELYSYARDLCNAQMPDSCEKDMTILTNMYSRQITSDCKGLANGIAQKKQEANAALSQAKSAVRTALKESFDSANEYDRGTCMVEYKKCMMGADACGSDWGNCVFTVAAENMQNNAAKSVKGTKVQTTDTYNITASTMEILESKRFICERVLDKCVANRDYVWNDFLREAAPTIRLAEQNIESNKRQSCLTDISNCIQKACKDDIVGKGEATMDACLARPDMARSFCKIQIDPCERMEPQIWDYVVSKLAAMRVDACTNEVKDCIMAEDRCGTDFMNCIGMDFDYIHDICPIDKLVVCKQTNPDFKMSDLDSMLMGLYLNIDNKALENCQNIVEQKMVEICGSTTDCNAFAANEFLGTGSLSPRKNGDIYSIAGLLNFGLIKMGDAAKTVTDNKKTLEPGEIGIADYITEIDQDDANKNVTNKDSVISSIKSELNNIAGTINRTISLIESDQQVQYCINGRNMSQINGKNTKDNTTTARFPNLLNQYRVAIAVSALGKAQENYNKKLNDEIAKATKNASIDTAQYYCQMLPKGNVYADSTSSSTANALSGTNSIVYEVGEGVALSELKKVQKEKERMASMKAVNANVSYTQGPNASLSVVNIPGGTKTMWTTFNRETRICHLCTEFITRECSNSNKNIGIFGVSKSNTNCGEETRTEDCQDIPM